MDSSLLGRYGRRIEYLLEANLPLQTQECVDEAAQAGDWDLLAALALTASEISARRMVDAALEAEQYDLLVLVACLRRQVRRPHTAGASQGVARRVFRDFDEETEDTAGIPDYILDDVREMRESADRRRSAAHRRDAEQDRDPIREHVIEGLAERLHRGEAAMDALVVIAKASAWESARRRAAMKLANHAASMGKLVAAGRWEDLVAVSRGASLHSVSGNISKALSERLSDIAAAGDRATLEFIAEYHPEREGKSAALKALQGLE